MRRTARALTVATVAGAVVSLAPAVHAGSSAEASPGTVAPGSTLTVTVRCDAGEGRDDTGHEKPGEKPREKPGAEPGDRLPPGHEKLGEEDDGDRGEGGDGDRGDRGDRGNASRPSETLEATSRAFEDGTVQLRRVPGEDTGHERRTTTTYRGTARISAGRDAEGSPEGVGPEAAWTVDGHCPGAPGASGAPGGRGAAWSATFAVSRYGEGQPCREENHGGCGHDEQAATVPGGVQAGDGGSFGVSVPALVAGGLLIAGAAGAALLRAHRAVRGTGGRP